MPPERLRYPRTQAKGQRPYWANDAVYEAMCNSLDYYRKIVLLGDNDYIKASYMERLPNSIFLACDVEKWPLRNLPRPLDSDQALLLASREKEEILFYWRERSGIPAKSESLVTFSITLSDGSVHETSWSLIEKARLRLEAYVFDKLVHPWFKKVRPLSKRLEMKESDRSAKFRSEFLAGRCKDTPLSFEEQQQWPEALAHFPRARGIWRHRILKTLSTSD